MLKAFSYMFKDEDFIVKYFLCAVLITIGSVVHQIAIGLIATPMAYIGLLLIGISIIAYFAFAGYGVDCIKYMIEKRNGTELSFPHINLGKNIVCGIKMLIAYIIMMIITGIILLLVSLICGLFGPVGMTVSFIISLIIMLYLSFLYMALVHIFAKTGSMTSFIKFGLAKRLISESGTSYWKGILFYVLLFLVLFIIMGAFIAVVGVSMFTNKNTEGIFPLLVILTLTGVFSAAYMNFVHAYVISKSIKEEDTSFYI